VREHGARARHENEEDAVRAPTAKAVSVTGEEHRGQRVSCKERCEDDAYGRVGVPPVCEGDADQHGAEAIGKRTRALNRDEAASVRGQAPSSGDPALPRAAASALHHA